MDLAGLANLEVHPCQEFLGSLMVLWVQWHHGPQEHLCLLHRMNHLFLPYGLEDLAGQLKPRNQQIKKKQKKTKQSKKKQAHEYAEKSLCFLEISYKIRTQQLEIEIISKGFPIVYVIL